MVVFTRLLRDNGFAVGVPEVHDALRVLGEADVTDVNQVRATLRTLFASREREWHRFDEFFDAFWLGRARHRRSILKQAPGAMARQQSGMHGVQSARPETLADYFDWKKDSGAFTSPASEGRAAGASNAETLAKADFSGISDPDEIERLQDLAERWAERIRYRLSRRRRAAKKGLRPLLRRTFQRSVSTGGMPLIVYRSQRKPKPVKILVFVDVSGSMDLYSLFFTRFVAALSVNFAETKAFVFHTRLVPISGALADRNPMKFMEKMSLISHGWSGGTRIGACLAEFNARYAKEHLGSNSIALVMSDGFDTGTADELSRQLAQLKRRVKRLIWLNPLLGRESYQPSAAGMTAALPYIDLFAPAHNLESLAAIEDELLRL
jgi:uncharacterized protein